VPPRDCPEGAHFFSAKPISIHTIDADGQTLDGRQRYTLRFPPDLLFRLGEFWSLSILQLPSGSLHVNPRGLIIVNSQRLRKLPHHADGTVTLLLQHDPPRDTPATHWLPVPYKPFAVELLNARIPPAEAAVTSPMLILTRIKQVTANPVP